MLHYGVGKEGTGKERKEVLVLESRERKGELDRKCTLSWSLYGLREPKFSPRKNAGDEKINFECG